MKKRLSSTVPRSAGPCVGGIVALLFTVTLSAPALAGKCKYVGGITDDGPCVEVRNRLKYRINDSMNVWCFRGPTSSTHKIVLRAGDSFTCRGGSRTTGHALKLQRKRVGCDTCRFWAQCDEKTVVSLRIESNREAIKVTCE